MLKIRENTPLIAICLCYLALVVIASVAKIPLEDESWFSSPAYNLIHHGNFGTTTMAPHGYMLRPEATHLDRQTYWVLPLELVTLVGWYAVFGFGLVQMRLMSAFFGALALIALNRSVLRLTGDRLAATVAALLMVQDNILLWRSADGRMEVMCLSLGLMGVAAYLKFRESSLNKALLFSATLVCLAGLTHPNGIITFLWLVTIVLVMDGRKLRLSHVIPFAIPFLVGAAAYSMYALRDLEGFRGQLLGNAAGDRVQWFSHPLTAIQTEFTMYGWAYGGSQYNPGRFAPLKFIQLAVWVAGYFGHLLIKGLKTPADRVLAICGAIPVIVLTFFNARNDYYLVYIVPFLAANAAVVFAHFWRGGLIARRLATAAVAATLLVSTAVFTKRILSQHEFWDEFRQMSEKANGLLPPAGRMIAPARYAFGIGFDRVIHDDNLGAFSKWCPPLIIDYGLTPDEVENMQKHDPKTLAYRDTLFKYHYRVVMPHLYERLTCPDGTHRD